MAPQHVYEDLKARQLVYEDSMVHQLVCEDSIAPQLALSMTLQLFYKDSMAP